MAIKESSDELNPTVLGGETDQPQRPARSLKDFVALAIATCGVGYLPLAPGTWGSLVAVGIYIALRLIVFRRFENVDATIGPLFYWMFVATELLAISAATFVGVWAASQTERLLNVKDPGKVVVDEVAGQLIALLPVPLIIDEFWPAWLVAAFLLFRFFDIVKPYPARKLESLAGGWGVMADDLIAGVYAAFVLVVLIAIRSFFL